MNAQDIADYRAALEQARRALEEEDELGRDAQGTVQLDQQSVGRLSRMDALQQQAMARATQTRRDGLKRKIDAALARIADGEYGYCCDCGEEIAPQRLAFDPAAPQCTACAAG